MSEKQKSFPKIIKFRKEDASKVAELFNSFDKEGLWPGGFTGGVPYTAERVIDSFPVGVKNICILIAKHNEKFTGICTLHPHFEDEEAAYIGVLGVHPNYLGKGHGKALILRSLQIAAEKKFMRVDLGTWAGNLRAVPLYKKCGMFWVPETSVEMHDYIPGIINFPLAREFFKKHDWYSSQKRKLELVPDMFSLESMEVFPYEFSKDEDNLKVWIDRYGRSILGIEYTLDGKHMKIMCKLKEHKIIAGLEHELAIEIRNDSGSIMGGSVFLSGFDGLSFTTLPQQSFNIENGASIELCAKFKVSPEIEIPEITRKQKTIKANIMINGQLIPLEIGIPILPLLKFTTFPENIAVTPGTQGEIQLNIFNNSKEKFTGKAIIIDEANELSINKTIIPIEIPSKSHSGLKFEIKAKNNQPTSLIPLELFAKGEVKVVNVKTKTKLIYVKCLNPGGMVTSIESTKEGRAVIVENEDIMARVLLREALLEITYKKAASEKRRIWNHGSFGVGPPFGFVKPIHYEYKILRRPESLELVLTGIHPDKPGLKMVRTLTFYSGSSLIKERIRLVNTNPDVTYKLNVRISGRSSIANMYKMIVPLKEITEYEMIEFPVSESDLSTDPKDYKESWICFQNQAQDYSFGQIWSNRKLSKIRIGSQSLFSPEYTLDEIMPGQSTCTSELYYLVERGNWPIIRRKWKTLIKQKLSTKEEVIIAKRLFDVKINQPMLYENAKIKTQLEIKNSRNKEVNGKIILSPPDGWTITPSQIKVTKVTVKNPFTTDVSLIPPSQAELGVHSGTISFLTDRQEIEFPLNLCLISKNARLPVIVTTHEAEGKTVFKVSNNLLTFKASPEFAGCLYFLGDNEVNQLGTGFPHLGTKVFLENYSGGIRALYLDERIDFQKSKTHKESHKAKLVEEGHWKGIEFSYESKEQEEIRGILCSVSYLTLPFSNVIKIKRKFKNPLSASFEFNNCLWLSPNIGGDFKKNTVVFPRDDKIFQFKRSEGVAISRVQPKEGWAFIKNVEKKIGLGIIVGNIYKSAILSLDLGKTLLELLIMSKIQLQSGESLKLEDYVFLGSENHETVSEFAQILRSKPIQRARS